MRVLFIGDVVGQSACAYLQQRLPKFRHDNNVDVIIINGENSADGNGITKYSAGQLFECGADAITTGNHCFKRFEASTLFEESDIVLRPANFGADCAGKGVCILDMGGFSLAVVNLIGTAYMQPVDNPFKTVEAILSDIKTPNLIVDFLAEATAEKKAMGFFLEGKVSAVLGTHTHVQTADEAILSGHTAYITDVGMTGVQNSVLGVDKDVIIQRLRTYYPQRHTAAEGKITMNAVLIDIDKSCGKCTGILRIND